jgi:drug/metabolite transporter (DMT)-like permease
LTPAALPLLWVPITVSAAFVQNIRSAGQKHLAGELNTMSVTMVRFMFGLPFGLLYVGFLQARTTDALPRMAAGFLGMVAMAGLAQIIGTGLLIYLFSLRNFAVGNAYARTEAVLTAVLGTLFFGETVARFGWAAILISVCGVLLITVARARLRGPELVSMLKDKAPWIGLLVGLGFSLTSLSGHRVYARTGRQRQGSGPDRDCLCAGLFLLALQRALDAQGAGRHRPHRRRDRPSRPLRIS